MVLLAAVSVVQAATCESLRATHGEGVVSVHCGGAPSAVVDADGRLWVAFVQNLHVYVARSDDLGASYSTPVRVNAEPEDAEHNGENRPKILVTQGTEVDGVGAEARYVFVSWTRKTSRNFTGEIRFSRSTDGGMSFEVPRTVNDDRLFTGHRFDSLFLTPSGTLYLTWVDKRDVEASAARQEPYPGAAIYYAVSEDLGTSFTRNFRVAHNSCECCRIAMALRGADRVAILWRQIFDEHIRDHAIAVLGPDGEITNLNRASVDDWRIDACPHHGPAMIPAAASDQYHMSWFSAGTQRSGIYYGRYDLASGSAANIFQVDSTPGAAHPHLAERDGTVYLAWKGFDGAATQLRLIESRDDGASWSAPRTLLTTSLASDHPLLVSSEHGVFLSWSTAEFGYVFSELSPHAGEVFNAVQ